MLPFEDTKMLEFHQYQKSRKTPFGIYAYLESFIKETHICKNNPEKSSITKVSENIPSYFSIFTISSVRDIEIKHNV